MLPSTIIVLSEFLSLGVPLAFAVRELVLLRHDKPGSPPAGGDAQPEPLPLCDPDGGALPPSVMPHVGEVRVIRRCRAPELERVGGLDQSARRDPPVVRT